MTQNSNESNEINRIPTNNAEIFGILTFLFLLKIWTFEIPGAAFNPDPEFRGISRKWLNQQLSLQSVTYAAVSIAVGKACCRDSFDSASYVIQVNMREQT